MMVEESSKGIKLFYCYAREDKTLRDDLERHLSSLKRQFKLINWHDREINPGMEWEKEIHAYLNTAHVILLLVSPDFMASDYCYGIEMKRALERHRIGEASVIPIIIRPVDWEEAPFSKLQVLPSDAKPITSWPNRDEAFRDVAKGIRKVVKERLKEQYLIEAKHLLTDGQNVMALAKYELIIDLYPDCAEAYAGKGNALRSLNRNVEALTVYEQALHLDPTNASYYRAKGEILLKLNRNKKALVAYEQALQFDPANAYYYYYEISKIFPKLNMYEALLLGARRQEIEIVLRRAEVDAARIAEQEKAEWLQMQQARQQQLPIGAINTNNADTPAVLPIGDLRCPNCGLPVKADDNFCSNCRYVLSPTESGLHRRASKPPLSSPPPVPLSSASVLPPGPMPSLSPSPPGVVPSVSIYDQPTNEMSPSRVGNGQVEVEKTLPYNVEHLSGRNMSMAVGTRSNPGIKRQHKPNEDSLFAAQGERTHNSQAQQFGLFVVADGMGGHANGQDASRLAIQTIVDRLLPRLSSNEHFSDDALVHLLEEGVQEANRLCISATWRTGLIWARP